MMPKSIFLTLILTLLFTACSQNQVTEPVTSSIAIVESIPTESATEQPISLQDSIETPQVVEVSQTNETSPSDETLQTNNADPRGYILFTPLRSTTTYLINNDGNEVHTWPSEYNPGNAVYLQENGNLLRTGSLRNSTFQAGGSGGIVQEINWEGDVVWQFEHASEQYLLHHDVEQLPNGNILMIAWEYKTTAEAIAAGRNPNLLPDNALWPDKIIEVDPTTNQIAWEWHIWDHLIQDYDSSQANYGNPSEHPELIDLNFTSRGVADWNHTNSVDYNPEQDQLLLSVHGFSEIWIIDHSTSTAEAATHNGGVSGKGGDLLYRWGNPQAYSHGTESDQQLFAQHDAQWIDPGLPGAGNILIFNNGNQRSRPYSTIEEITPQFNVDGSYTYMADATYAPTAPTWSYIADATTDFFATNISGVQRLPNGNTLICNGPSGEFFEVTSTGEIVWEYTNPFGQSMPNNNSNADGSQNPVFRANYYAADYAGFTGHELNVNLNSTTAIQDTGNQSVASGQQEPNQGTGGQNEPPKSAIDACVNINVGDTCTFETPRGTLAGTCSTLQTQIVCKPEGRP